MKAGYRQWIFSVAIFAIVMGGLVSVDERVHDRLSAVISGGDVSSLGHRLGDLGGALLAAARYQSIENAPIVIFATVGALLVLFMVRT